MSVMESMYLLVTLPIARRDVWLTQAVMESTGTRTNLSRDNVGCLDLGRGVVVRDRPTVALTTI